MSNYFPSLYQEFIFTSRYAKYIDSKNRRETLDETVARYFDFFQEYLETNHNFNLAPDRKELEEAVLNLSVMPSMRGLMTAGAALKRDEAAL